MPFFYLHDEFGPFVKIILANVLKAEPQLSFVLKNGTVAFQDMIMNKYAFRQVLKFKFKLFIILFINIVLVDLLYLIQSG